MTATIEPSSRVIASFRVPTEPIRRDMTDPIRRDNWVSWFACVRAVVNLNAVPRATGPCRVVAVVKRCDGPRYNPVTAQTIERWRDGVRAALERSRLVPADSLRAVEVRFEAVGGVDVPDRPRVDGTYITIFGEGN